MDKAALGAAARKAERAVDMVRSDMARSASTKLRHALRDRLMSGTSLDGIDVAAVETDGVTGSSPGPAMTVPYPSGVPRKAALGARRRRPRCAEVEAELTRLHAEAVGAVSRALSGDRGRADRLSRPHDPASPGRAPNLADRRRRAAGATGSGWMWSPISAPPMSRRAARGRRWRRCFTPRSPPGCRSRSRSSTSAGSPM